jgi:hypothetical protein
VGSETPERIAKTAWDQPSRALAAAPEAMPGAFRALRVAAGQRIQINFFFSIPTGGCLGQAILLLDQIKDKMGRFTIGAPRRGRATQRGFAASRDASRMGIYNYIFRTAFDAIPVICISANALMGSTTLGRAQVEESSATPETMPFWQLPSYTDHVESAGLAAAGYRLQYYQPLAQPFYLAAMVLRAAPVSLRFFPFGGVQKMVLGGIGAGFVLSIVSKVTGDLSKAGMMGPLAAAGLPPALGGITGLLVLLYKEDG